MMKTIALRGADKRAVDSAVAALREGKTILYPTDTLYALGCNALDNKAIASLCHIKGINPEKNTLSVICANISQAAQYARIDNKAFNILKRYLPGPFTFILPAATSLPKTFKNRRAVGIRIPDNDFDRAVSEELDAPILTSSAADSGTPFVEIEDTMAKSGAIALAFVDDDINTDALPTTVVDLTDSSAPVIVRQGQGVFDD